MTPVAPGLVGVAALTARVGSFDDHLTGFPALLDRLAGAEPDGRVLGAGPFARGSRRRTAERVLLVGDASGYVDALTGEGLSVGFTQAVAAVDAVAAGRPCEYERAWRRLAVRTATWTASASFRAKDGKFVEFVEEWNELPMFEQLGRPAEECLTYTGSSQMRV